MYVIQIADGQVFLNKVQELTAVGIRPRVVRTATAVPRVVGGNVVLQPAIVLQYSIEFWDDQAGDTEWVYRETRFGGLDGTVDLSDTLLPQLQPHVTIVHRSGSF